MDPIPLVIVEGFMSSAGALVWGNFEQHLNHASQSRGGPRRRSIFTSVGPVSSLHDRACELFYLLAGGTVDYGAKHSLQYGHGRFGRTHDVGLYPEWSVQHPLHFLGHSMGGPTIMKLQWLLSTGFFGPERHPDMILSVNTISSPFRGTQLVYSLGEDARDAPAVRPLSAGDLLAKGVHVLSYLAPLLPAALDLHAEARALSFREASPRALLAQLRRSDWATSRDATPFDATFLAAEERERAGEGAPRARTFYRSYCATLGDGGARAPAAGVGGALSSLLQGAVAWPFHLASEAVAAFDFSTLRPTPAFLKTSLDAVGGIDIEDGVAPAKKGESPDALRLNDGVVPLLSQWHPYDCGSTRCKHLSHRDDILSGAEPELAARYASPPEAGIWHVHHLEGSHHLSIVPLWVGATSQKAFWEDIGHWLCSIDDVGSERGL